MSKLGSDEEYWAENAIEYGEEPYMSSTCPTCGLVNTEHDDCGGDMGPKDITVEKMLEWASAKPAKKVVGCTDSTKIIGTPVEMWLGEIGAVVDNDIPEWLEAHLDSTDTDWMGEIMEDLVDNYGERTLVTAEEVAGELRAFMELERGMHHNC